MGECERRRPDERNYLRFNSVSVGISLQPIDNRRYGGEGGRYQQYH